MGRINGWNLSTVCRFYCSLDRSSRYYLKTIFCPVQSNEYKKCVDEILSVQEAMHVLIFDVYIPPMLRLSGSPSTPPPLLRHCVEDIIWYNVLCACAYLAKGRGKTKFVFARTSLLLQITLQRGSQVWRRSLVRGVIF